MRRGFGVILVTLAIVILFAAVLWRPIVVTQNTGFPHEARTELMLELGN